MEEFEPMPKPPLRPASPIDAEIVFSKDEDEDVTSSEEESQGDADKARPKRPPRERPR